ncbi:hypothetical protein B0I35DRAFT_363856 [Stachybotrys elegans]|uniref:Uncharacterized protein n=1 Tax=Stachybotrys elegans TaxID=80388 RepID=A0A8K0SC10_9HYPO|nr:hypothetical protein B0I35DRAFT_363856 [Stachybotrys elegans]
MANPTDARRQARSAPTVSQMEQAALHVLRLIRDTPGLENTKLAVIGDLAVCKYLPKYDAVASIDFVISKSSSPGRVRKDIVGHPMSPLVDKSGDVYYRHASGWEVEVKLIPDWVCPFLPAAARAVRHDVTTIPYISLQDLIVFKVDACGLRESTASKRREACEAAALLALASEHSPCVMEASKLEKIQQDLSDIVEFCSPEHNKSWWQMSLGMQPDKRRSAQEILSDISDDAFSPPSTPASSISRSSSYTSANSSHSASSSISSISSPDKNGRPRKMSMTGNPTLRHKRHTSSTGGPTLDAAMRNLGIARPNSPGVALTDRIN